MGYTISYRSCHPVTPDQETAIRQAAESFNQGREWVLNLQRNPNDGHLLCFMKSIQTDDGKQAAGPARSWPGAYEAKCLLEALCGISRDCKVAWEIRDPHCARPIGIIRDGACHADPEAQAEAARNMVEAHSRTPRN
jgi:hypothetical protein